MLYIHVIHSVCEMGPEHGDWDWPAMTAFKRLGLLALWLLVFAIFSACAVSGVLSTNRLVRILGSLLGLIPASLHFRTSQTQTPPRRFWRYCSVVIIVTFGSLCFLPWCPGWERSTKISLRIASKIDHRGYIEVMELGTCPGPLNSASQELR